jgi:molybdopterin biosynthesis enzyme MoaB
LFEKGIPGIMDIISIKYGQSNPAAILSHSVSGVLGQTVVFNLPGSPKGD